MLRLSIHSLLVLLFFCFTAGCKKDKEPDTVYTADFSHTGGVGLNSTVLFKSDAPDGSTITWDFGDSTSGAGVQVSHHYNGYGCFPVTMVARLNDKSYQITKKTAVSPFTHVFLTGVMIEQVPPFSPGGQSWDPGDDPDLRVTVTVPASNPYTPPTVLNNSIAGLITFNGIDAMTYDQDLIIDIDDIDPGGPQKMAHVTFKLCDYIGSSLPFSQSLTVVSGTTRIKVNVSWVQ